MNRLWLQVLPAREGQQALCQRSAPLGTLHGAVHQAQQVGVAADTTVEQVEVGDHRHQQVVEVVRDAARELPDRLQLLRLPQLLLGLSQTRLLPQPFGHVVDELVRPDALARRIPEHAEAHLVGPAGQFRVAELTYRRIGPALDGRASRRP